MFIRIKDGLYVKKSEIEAVEQIDEYSCRIYTGKTKYEAKMPASTILKFLNSYEDGLGKDLKAFLKTQGFFAG